MGKTTNDPKIACCVYMRAADKKWLLREFGSVSKGVQKLVAAARGDDRVELPEALKKLCKNPAAIKALVDEYFPSMEEIREALSADEIMPHSELPERTDVPAPEIPPPVQIVAPEPVPVPKPASTPTYAYRVLSQRDVPDGCKAMSGKPLDREIRKEIARQVAAGRVPEIPGLESTVPPAQPTR